MERNRPAWCIHNWNFVNITEKPLKSLSGGHFDRKSLHCTHLENNFNYSGKQTDTLTSEWSNHGVDWNKPASEHGYCGAYEPAPCDFLKTVVLKNIIIKIYNRPKPHRAKEQTCIAWIKRGMQLQETLLSGYNGKCVWSYNNRSSCDFISSVMQQLMTGHKSWRKACTDLMTLNRL